MNHTPLKWSLNGLCGGVDILLSNRLQLNYGARYFHRLTLDRGGRFATASASRNRMKGVTMEDIKNVENNVEKVENPNVEQLAALTKQIEEMQAELNSFKTENETVLKEAQTLKEENLKLKEMNYTFARHFDAETAVEDVETQLYNLFGEGRKRE